MSVGEVQAQTFESEQRLDMALKSPSVITELCAVAGENGSKSLIFKLFDFIYTIKYSLNQRGRLINWSNIKENVMRDGAGLHWWNMNQDVYLDRIPALDRKNF